LQFHFHHPGENRLMGKSFPMEVHLVHKDSEGHIAVIGVFLKVGADNPVVHEEFDHLPQAKGAEITVPNVMVDATELLPASRA
jgi:carbonic anhydrase